MKIDVQKLDSEELVNAAYDRVKGDFAKVETEELATVNLDIQEAVMTILGALPEAKALRPRFVKELPMFDVAAFDKLEDYALGLSYAHSAYLVATKPPDDFEALSVEATNLRERLLLDARSLSKHQLVDEKILEELKGANGIKNIVQDLQTLALALQKNWSQIQGKSPTTEQDLQTALRLSARLMRIIGLKEQGPKLTAEATANRARAYTVTMGVYDETRRAISYLRSREGDVDTITPSLYSGKSRPEKKTIPPVTKPGEGDPKPPVTTAAVPHPAIAAEQAKSSPTASKGPFMAS